MLATYPKLTVLRVRGWPLFLFGLVLAIGVSIPAISPAAMAQRSVPPPPTAPDPPPVPPLWMPVAGSVVRGFDTRAGPYGPGHRGIDIAASVGEMVRAPAAGRVMFAGPVAGTTWVSLLVAPGVLVTLGPMLDPPITAERVGRRAPVGRLGPGHALPPAGPVSVGRAPVGPAPETHASVEASLVTRGGPGGAGSPAGPVGISGVSGMSGPSGPVGPSGVGGPSGVKGATLHLSVRVNGVYVDPLVYLVDRPRPRLAPLLTPGGLPGG